MRPLALLLPVAALAMVAVAAIIAGALSSGGGSRLAAPATATASPTAAETPKAAVRDASVCDGLLRVPDPGQPPVFPAVYTQVHEVLGIHVVGTARISEAAFAKAADTIEMMFAHNDLEAPLAAQGAYVAIAEPGQGVLDVPEFACLGGELGTDFFTHVCGIADRADYPVVTVNELDLLGDRSGPCGGKNVLIHELGHLVQSWSLPPADYFDIRQFYQDALDAGKYRGQYAATNANEYFAEGTQAYFTTGGGQSRAWLERYDPSLFALVARTYGP